MSKLSIKIEINSSDIISEIIQNVETKYEGEQIERVFFILTKYNLLNSKGKLLAKEFDEFLISHHLKKHNFED